LARYPTAAASTPLDVVANPLALQGAAAAVGIDTQAAAARAPAPSALTTSAPSALPLDLVIAELLRRCCESLEAFHTSEYPTV
jgi:hypothetical protein